MKESLLIRYSNHGYHFFGISDFLLSENGRELNNVPKENNEQLNINIKNHASLKVY